MLFEVLSCISHVKVYIVAEVYCLYCRPCPAQTDPCQMDRDTQIIQRSLCFIFHLFFFLLYFVCFVLFSSALYSSFVLSLPDGQRRTDYLYTVQGPFCLLQGAFSPIFSTITKNELPPSRESLNVNKLHVGCSSFFLHFGTENGMGP